MQVDADFGTRVERDFGYCLKPTRFELVGVYWESSSTWSSVWTHLEKVWTLKRSKVTTTFFSINYESYNHILWHITNEFHIPHDSWALVVNEERGWLYKAPFSYLVISWSFSFVIYQYSWVHSMVILSCVSPLSLSRTHNTSFPLHGIIAFW